MRRIGVYIDLSNLYYCISERFGKGRKIDYKKFKLFIDDLGIIQQMVAYGIQYNTDVSNFAATLKKLGYTVKFKSTDGRAQCNWDVGMTVDIFNMIDAVDRIVLASSNPLMIPLIEWAKQKGKDVIIIACGISSKLRNEATTYIEIPESLLEVPKTLEPVNESTD